MSDEYKLGHLFKPTEALDKRFGNAGVHLSRLHALGGAISPMPG
jgi:hypothetical protein